jgi:hypothetical protein
MKKTIMPLFWGFALLCVFPMVSQAAVKPEAIARQFIQTLAGKDYAVAVASFDETMRQGLPAEKLQTIWEGFLQQAGPFVRQVESHVRPVDRYQVVDALCQYARAQQSIRVTVNDAGKIGGLWFGPLDFSVVYRAPAYVNPDAFVEREVTIGKGSTALPGTLTLPNGHAKAPGIVLVHGSGPNDRDETLGPNKPFRDLAWGLASQGIAVLRYEKRTKVYPELFTSLHRVTIREEVTDDALAAVALLRNVKEVDPQRVFLLGHSLGGMLAPRIGLANPKIAGLIIMAGPTRTLEDMIVAQYTYLAKLDGKITPEEQQQLDAIARQAARVKDPKLAPSTPANQLLGVPAPYWLDLRGYKPADAAKSVKRLMLILQGGRDYQVTMEDYAGWQSALDSRNDVTFKLYPALNHLFMAGEGPSGPAEYDKTGHVEAAVVSDIAQWMAGLRKR